MGETMRSSRSLRGVRLERLGLTVDKVYPSLIISFARDSMVQQPRYLPLRSVTTAIPTEDCNMVVRASCRVSSGWRLTVTALPLFSIGCEVRFRAFSSIHL